MERPGPPDERVDDTVTARMLAPHLLRALLFLVLPTLLLVVWLVLGYLAAMSSPSATAAAVEEILGFAVVVLYLAGLGAAFVPAKEPIAEWSRLVADAGPEAAGAVQRLHDAASRRCPARADVERVGGVEVLVLAQRTERALIVVQPYGADLYVGWTLWRARSTATLLVHFLRDTFLRGPSGPGVPAELRAAATRAFRESVHALARGAVAAPEPRADTAAPGTGAAGTGGDLSAPPARRGSPSRAR